MHRIAIVSTIGLLSVVAATAGSVQIEVGGSNGLTQAYIASGCSGSGPCVAGSVSAGTTEGTFNNVLFQGQAPSTPPPSPTITDGTAGETFAMINDSASSGSNTWDLPMSTTGTGGVTQQITIPIGVYGVTDVWTMLNDITSTQPIGATVFFNFGLTSNATAVDSVRVQLNNSSSSTAAQVRDGCENGNLCPTTGAVGSLLATTTLTDTNTSSLAMTVDANNVFSGTNSNNCEQIQGSQSPCVSDQYLDDQGFIFNDMALTGTAFSGQTNLSTYLVSITVRESNTANTTGLGLTAVTLDAATPEPSTVLLLLIGLGVIAFGTLRKARA